MRVFSSLDFYEMQLVRAALESSGIPVHLVPDPNLLIASGDVPYIEAMPEVFVPRIHEAAARQVLASLAEGAGEPWRCPGCGEEVDGELGCCWSCGRTAPTANQPVLPPPGPPSL